MVTGREWDEKEYERFRSEGSFAAFLCYTFWLLRSLACVYGGGRSCCRYRRRRISEIGFIDALAAFTVTPAVLSSIQVHLDESSIAKGTSTTATGVYTDGSTQDIGDQVSWTSSATTVATVSNADGTEGRATGVDAGSTTITATYAGKSNSTILTVL